MQTILYVSNEEITNRQAAAQFFNSLKKKDGKYLITAKEISRRTLPQNSFFHVLCSMLVEPLRDAGYEWVYTTEDAKHVVKDHFLKVSNVNEKTGEIIYTYRRTSEMSKEEMQILIDDIYRWAAEYLNTVLPEAGQPMKMFN